MKIFSKFIHMLCPAVFLIKRTYANHNIVMTIHPIDFVSNHLPWKVGQIYNVCEEMYNDLCFRVNIHSPYILTWIIEIFDVIPSY